MPKAPILPKLPQLKDTWEKDRESLWKFLRDLMKALFVFMNKLQSFAVNTATVNGMITYFYSDNYATNSATDIVMNIDLPFDIEITKASIFGIIAATGTSPTVQVRNAAGGAGSGMTITLDATKKFGTATGSVTILSGNPLYLRGTDCLQFGGFNISIGTV